jgi:predicted enzyme related to lactoylglutathione lyase
MPGGGTYTVMRRAGTPAAGVMARPARATFRSHWLPYVATANVDDTATHARGLGATITTKPTDIPGIGRFAVLTDPAAARSALLSATA